jgi:hypothetical protein
LRISHLHNYLLRPHSRTFLKHLKSLVCETFQGIAPTFPLPSSTAISITSNNNNTTTTITMNGGWVFLIILILAILLGGGGYLAYRKFYLKRNDLPTFNYPAPAPSGLVDRVKEAWGRLRNPKTQTGAGYEPSGGYRGASGGRRGHALDPDEAWDSRVGNEAEIYGPNSGHYEEQELGLHQPTEYRGGGGGAGFRQAETLGAPAGGAADRSRSPGRSNPFGDDNAASLRSVSPRPHLDTSGGGAQPQGRGSAESSPTFERRSIFRENV